MEGYTGISLHVATENTRTGGTYVTVSFMQVITVTDEPLSADEEDPSLTLEGEDFACVMLNNSETSFVIVELAMGIAVNQQQHWLKYVEKFCDVFFRESLYFCCQSNSGLAQLQPRMAAHKVTQPLPIFSSL